MNLKKTITIIIILTLVVVCTILPVFAQISIYLEVDNVLYATPGTIRGYKVTDWKIDNYSGSQVTWDLEGYYEIGNWTAVEYYGFSKFRCKTNGRFQVKHTGYRWSASSGPPGTLVDELEDVMDYPCGTPDAEYQPGHTNNAGELTGNVRFHFFVIEGGDDTDYSEVIDWFVDNDVAMEPMSDDESLEAYRNLKIQIAFQNRVRPFKFDLIEGYDFRFHIAFNEGDDSVHFSTSVEPNEKYWGVLAQYIDYSTITKTAHTYTSYQYYHPVTNSTGTTITGQNISLTMYSFDMVMVPNGNYSIDWSNLAGSYIMCTYSSNENYNYASWFSRRVTDYLNGVIDMPTLTSNYNSALLKYSSGTTGYNTIQSTYKNLLPSAIVDYNPNSVLEDVADNLDDVVLYANNHAGDFFGTGSVFANIFNNGVVIQMLVIAMPVLTMGYFFFGKRIH